MSKSRHEAAHALDNMLISVSDFQIFLFLGSMCFILAIGHGIWENKKGYYFQNYLPWKEYVPSSAVSAILVFWSYFIILNTMVPISLYVRWASLTTLCHRGRSWLYTSCLTPQLECKCLGSIDCMLFNSLLSTVPMYKTVWEMSRDCISAFHIQNTVLDTMSYTKRKPSLPSNSL